MQSPSSSAAGSHGGISASLVIASGTGRSRGEPHPTAPPSATTEIRIAGHRNTYWRIRRTPRSSVDGDRRLTTIVLLAGTLTEQSRREKNALSTNLHERMRTANERERTQSRSRSAIATYTCVECPECGQTSARHWNQLLPPLCVVTSRHCDRLRHVASLRQAASRCDTIETRRAAVVICRAMTMTE